MVREPANDLADYGDEDGCRAFRAAARKVPDVWAPFVREERAAAALRRAEELYSDLSHLSGQGFRDAKVRAYRSRENAHRYHNDANAEFYVALRRNLDLFDLYDDWKSPGTPPEARARIRARRREEASS